MLYKKCLMSQSNINKKSMSKLVNETLKISRDFGLKNTLYKERS